MSFGGSGAGAIPAFKAQRQNDQPMSFPGWLRGLRLLTPHDDEFHAVQYLLRASLASLSVNLMSVHAVNSPLADANWEGSHIGTPVLDSWVNSEHLPDGNTIKDIISHGGQFQIPDPDKGAIFSAGVIPIDDDPSQASAGPQRYQFLLCRIAVGRSFVVDPRQIGAHGIPSGYSSIAIHKKEDTDAIAAAAASGAAAGLGTNDKGEPTLGTAPYFREYILNDESRIYPKYVVSFTFDPQRDRIKAVPLCESCMQRGATVYCIQDNAKLCPACDRDLHSQSQVQARHKRVLLNEMQAQIGMTMCEEHPSMPVEFYDVVSHIPVCVRCRMEGSHSAGEFARHKLVPVAEAYTKSMQDVDEERRFIEKRRQAIRMQLGSIERRMAECNENHEKCNEQLMKIVNEAVQAIQEETQSKLAALMSDDAELRRQLEFYHWLEAFLTYQRSFATPVEFLQAFKNQSAMLAKAPSEIVDNAAEVKPTMRIVGRIEIIVDDKIEQQGRAAAAAAGGAGAGTPAGLKSALKSRGGFQQRKW